MAGSRSDPLLTTIERPRCLRCRARTRLAGISPGRLGYELRTFKCLNCKRVQRTWVINAPMCGEAGERLDGGPKSPN